MAPLGKPFQHDYYSRCELCGRRCAVDRLSGLKGFCGESAELRIATASIHRGEEPPVTGEGGSGTIFFTGCTLRCNFCQNWQISRSHLGRAVGSEEFADIALALDAAGAENVNLVTGSHAVPAIVDGLFRARERGLAIPALWNSSAYESLAALDLLADQVSVYLPDLKTLDGELSARFFHAPDYPEQATAAILHMADSHPLRVGLPRSGRTDGPQVMHGGVMVRHLVLPGRLDDTRAVFEWFARNLRGRALLSVMTQYTPVRVAGTAEAPLPSKSYVSESEYEAVLAMLAEYGLEDGYCQELETGNDWLPDFERINPFSSALSTPVWHWKTGFSV